MLCLLVTIPICCAERSPPALQKPSGMSMHRCRAALATLLALLAVCGARRLFDDDFHYQQCTPDPVCATDQRLTNGARLRHHAAHRQQTWHSYGSLHIFERDTHMGSWLDMPPGSRRPRARARQC